MLKREELANPGSCFNRAKDDEMVFVLLARDVAAPEAIYAWARTRVEMGKNKWTDPQIEEALRCADSMRDAGEARDAEKR
jgi:hypothetical protein